MGEDAGLQGRHAWQFMRTGGVDQVVFRHGEDIARLGELDPKLWVALACPTQGLEFDSRTLELIDTNKDGRIRPPELIAACEWACRELRDPDQLLAGGDTLSVADLPEDSALAAEARRVLQIVGKRDDDVLTVTDVTGRSELLAAMRFNGDGIVTVETALDAPTQDVIRRILATHGSVNDRNGEAGIDRVRAEAFYAEVDALHSWQSQGTADGATRPLGAATIAAAQAVDAVHDKVEDFFARCRVAAYDIQAVQALNPVPAVYEALAGQALNTEALRGLPLAAITPGRTLPLQGHVNPGWSDALERLWRDAVQPLLGDAAAGGLSEAQWHQLKAQLATCREWLRSRPATHLGSPDAAALGTWLAARAAVMALIAEDEGVEAHNLRIVDLERLLRYKRDLLTLLHNFVSFKAFYRREGAIFQAGTLYLDGRSCDLTVRVDDAKKHAMLAGLAKTCLAYCDCTREGKKMGIVAAFTAGDIDFLFVGRNGVFYDRQGHDWDASITKLIENPTSVAQAFFSPYKKFVRLLEEQVAKRAAASEATAQTSLSSMATTLTTADQAGAAKPGVVPKAGPKIDVGTVAAIGVAMGSISAVLVGIFAKFVDLGAWIPIAIAGIVIAISGPSMLIAWLKLRQRSLGPILDASGWAINGRMKVNVRLGASLSKTAHVPPKARRMARDPYAERHGRAGVLAVVVLAGALAVLSWRMGWLDTRLPPVLQHDSPPAAQGVPAAPPSAPAPTATPP